MRELFEKWVIEQFGDSGKVLLRGFDEKEGYPDEMANSMWIGFNAGYMLKPQNVADNRLN